MKIKWVVISNESQNGTHVSLSAFLGCFLRCYGTSFLPHPCSSFLPLHSGIDLAQRIKYLPDHLPVIVQIQPTSPEQEKE